MFLLLATNTDVIDEGVNDENENPRVCYTCGLMPPPPNPLVAQGLIDPELAQILAPPPGSNKKIVKRKKKPTEARVLTGK